MKAVITLASISLLTLSATAVQAQNADGWTGPYISIYVGTFLDTDQSSSDRFEFDTNLDGSFGEPVTTAAGADAFSPGSCNGAPNGPTPGSGCVSYDSGSSKGLRAGYDWQLNNWVFGILGEYSRGDLRDVVTSFSTTPASYTMSRKLDDIWALRGRVGYAFGAGTDSLFYATAGVVQAGIQNAFTTSNGVNSFSANGDDDVDGGQWGLGFEHRFTDAVTVGVEYLYTRLEDDGYRVRAAGPAPATNPFIRTNAAGTDFRRSDRYVEPESVHVTASWRF